VLFLVIEAKLPLYGFKRVEAKDLSPIACKERSVAFLDSIILGQVVIELLWLSMKYRRQTRH